jgi:uncharacterized damage-inducible protein DinB
MATVLPTEAESRSNAQVPHAALARAFATVSDHLVKAAEMVPDDQYDSAPAAGIRSFLRLVAHAADGNIYYSRLARGEKVEWAETAERTVRGKSDAVRALRESAAACSEVYVNARSSVEPLVENLAHANLHYGNVIVYLRALGIVPPSS